MIDILSGILAFLAKAYIKIYKPKIIAITGNVGKTSTKYAMAAVLKSKYRVRSAGGNLNNELGVPLTILGDYAADYYDKGSTAGFWLKVILKGLRGLFYQSQYPEFLVLEYGADRPGDISRLAGNFKPTLAVVTAVGAIPVHVEFFEDAKALAAEKSKLLKFLNASDHAVLSADDPQVLEMRHQTKAGVKTFGFSEEASARISDFTISLDEQDNPVGIRFKINHHGAFIPIRFNGSLGQSQAMAAAAAATVGLILGINLVDIGSALEHCQGPAGRLRILKGLKETTIIDDTYNSSPASAVLALETLKHLPGNTRKIAILGDMLELGKYSVEAHQGVGKLAGRVAQVLICVGDKAKLIADSALGGINQENIYNFHTSEEAKSHVLDLIQRGDIILVKGSQGMRMEKIVEVIMAEPERKRELLVRQSRKWLDKN